MTWLIGEDIDASKINMPYAWYRSNDTQTITNGADTTVRFQIARYTSPLVTPNGTGNSYFTIQPGLWLIQTAARLNADINFELFLSIGTTHSIAGIQSLSGCWRNGYTGAFVVATAATNICVGIWQNSGANRFPQIFGNSPYISFLRLEHR